MLPSFLKKDESSIDEALSRERRKRGCCLGVAVAILGFLVWASFFIQPAKESARQTQCRNNIKQIGIALHSYHDYFKCLPPAYTVDENGKPLHSWRVVLLPFLEQQELYDKIRLDEPWDSEYNKQFHSRMPMAFSCPTVPQKKHKLTMTSYMRIVGPNTTTTGADSVAIKDIGRPLEEIVTLVEVYPTVNWMEPIDISPEQFAAGIDSKKKQGVGSYHKIRLHLGTLDGAAVEIEKPELPLFYDKTTFPKKDESEETAPTGALNP